MDGIWFFLGCRFFFAPPPGHVIFFFSPNTNFGCRIEFFEVSSIPLDLEFFSFSTPAAHILFLPLLIEGPFPPLFFPQLKGNFVIPFLSIKKPLRTFLSPPPLGYFASLSFLFLATHLLSPFSFFHLNRLITLFPFLRGSFISISPQRYCFFLSLFPLVQNTPFVASFPLRCSREGPFVAAVFYLLSKKDIGEADFRLSVLAFSPSLSCVAHQPLSPHYFFLIIFFPSLQNLFPISFFPSRKSGIFFTYKRAYRIYLMYLF